MLIADPTQVRLCNEVSLMLETLPLDDAVVLELGCGKAEKTRALAASGRPRQILALEVDMIQHAKNLLITDLPGVQFHRGGAEAIPAADDSIDLVIMLKSLHHVPVSLMDQALGEIARVLRPGGLAWISEPVFAGDMNEVMRLFHDEQTVRAAAFSAVCRAVDRGQFELERQMFFNTRSTFDNFAEFEARMINVTHSQHTLSPELHRAVQEKFASYAGGASVTFLNPQRVDLLKKPD